MSGFAEEVKSAQLKKGPSDEQVAKAASDPNAHFDMPEDASVAPVLPAGGKEEQYEEPAPTPAKVRIAGKDFESVEEALKYAEQLELEKLTRSAYEQGKEEAQPKASEAPQEPAVDPLIKEIEDELFVEPSKAVAKLIEIAKAKAKEEYERKESEKQAELKHAAQKEEAFKKFYGANPDLADFRDTVDYVIDRDLAELGKLDPDKAFVEVAARARKLLGIARDASLPTKTLESKPAVMGASTGAPGLAPKASTEPSALDFITQVNKHRKRI